MNDSSLWGSFLTGDEKAYCRIYQKYAKSLFIQGMQFSSDKELVQDCIHDLFVKIYESRERLGPIQNLKVYLFVALRNSIVTALKKQKVWFDELEDEAISILDEHTAEDNILIKETEEEKKLLLENIFSILTDRQKEVIHYRFMEALSIDEISLIMGMNYQSVQNLLQRSINKIKINIKKDEKGEYKKQII